MEQSLAQALEEYLHSMEQDRATVNDFLAHYPQHALILRSLEQTAERVRDLPSPTSSADGFDAGKQRMLEAVEEKRRRAALSEQVSLPPERVNGLVEKLERLVAQIRPAILRLSPVTWMTRVSEVIQRLAS